MKRKINENLFVRARNHHQLEEVSSSHLCSIVVR